MNGRKTITLNLLFLFLGQGASGILFFIAMVYLARTLGPDGFGIISFSEVVFMFFLTMSNLGLSFIGTREVARERDRVTWYVDRILTVRLLLGFLAFLSLIVCVFVLPKPIATKYTAVIYGLALIPASIFLDWLFQGIEKMYYIAIGVITRAVIFTLGAFWFIQSSGETVTVAYIFVTSWLLASAIVLFFYVRQSGLPKFKWEPSAQKRLLRDSWPIGVSLFVGWIIHYFDSTILFLLKGGEAAGQYNAAYRPIILIATALTVYFNAIFPAMSRSARGNGRSMKKIVNMTMGGGLVLLLPVAVLGTYLSKHVIKTVYGPEFTGSISIFALLLWWPLFLLMSNVYTRILVCYDKQKYIGRVSAITAVLNIGFNLILIPFWGGIGAAVAKIGTDLITFFIYHGITNRLIHLPVLNLAVCPIIAIGAMLLFISMTSVSNLWIIAIGGSITYIVVLFISSRFVPRAGQYLSKASH